MARPTKPAAEKKLCGSRVRKKAAAPVVAAVDPSADAAPKSDIPLPPAWLTDDLAKAEWVRLVPDLMKMRVLSPMDSVNLAMLCQATAAYVKAQQIIAAKGSTYTTTSKHGEMERVRPEVKIAAEAEKTILRITKEFGLAPLSRARMATAHASNGVQLELPNFGAVAPNQSAKPHDQQPSQGTAPAAQPADNFFGYGAGTQVH